jgi:hypothetical protein
MKLPKKSKRPTNLEIYKSIRKEPTPPGRIIQPKDREHEREVDEEEIDHWLGWRGEDLDEFEE